MKIARLRISYILALLITAMGVLSSEFVVQRIFQNQNYDAAEINFSGRQRMLSQRMTKNTALLSQAVTPEETAYYLSEIKSDFTDFERAHRALQYGDYQWELDEENSQENLKLFQLLEEPYARLVLPIQRLLAAAAQPDADVATEARKILPALHQAEKAFLPVMEQIVKQYTLEANQKHIDASYISLWLSGGILMLLLLQALLIFRPTYLRLKTAYDDLLQATAAGEQQNAALVSKQTELQDSLNQLETLNRTLLRRNEELDQFTYIASHDLKTPIRGVSNLTQWLEEEEASKLSDEGRTHLKMIRVRLERMEALINGVLRYAGIGKSEQKEQKVAVHDLLEILKQRFQKANARLVCEGNFPIMRTQLGELEEVFKQLIENGLQHNHAEFKEITISYHGIRENHVFCVKDNGKGIASDYHDKVFQMFQTLESKDQDGGTGMGLAIVKKIVEERGGKVWLVSEVNQGTSVWFTWPEIKLASDAPAR